METNTIFKHNAEDLSFLDDESVDLTITSPPYWNAIDYDLHAKHGTQKWYRTRKYSQGFGDYKNYLDWLDRIFGQLLPKTKRGGFCSVVIGTVLLNGKHYPLPFNFITRMVGQGWDFHQDIIWHKVTGGVKRAGSFIQHPFPGYYYPNIMTEYILIFRRPGKPIYSQKTEAEKEDARVEIDELFKMELANNVWHIPPVPPGTIKHPCPFPEEIPYRLVRLYSYPNDLVFDPFLGSGQTIKVAHRLGRRYVGIDLEEEYIRYAKSRLQEPLALRKEQIYASFRRVGFSVQEGAFFIGGPLFEKTR